MRRPHRPSSFTSLIDVLFILVFAALAQRAASGSSAASEPAPTPPPAPIPDAAPVPGVEATAAFVQVRSAGIAAAAEAIEGREVVVVRVSAAGEVRGIESATESFPVTVPLLERVSDPDVALSYLGARSPELRLCVIAARSTALDGRLVVVALDAPLAELRVALVEGLRRDVERCQEQGALAVLLEGQR